MYNAMDMPEGRQHFMKHFDVDMTPESVGIDRSVHIILSRTNEARERACVTSCGTLATRR